MAARRGRGCTGQPSLLIGAVEYLQLWRIVQVDHAAQRAYAFVQGLTYAGFSAVVLEAIGRGAAATKYNLLASLSNMPIAWVTLVNGGTYEHHGPAAFLWADAATGVGGLLVFGVAVAWSRRRLQAA